LDDIFNSSNETFLDISKTQSNHPGPTSKRRGPEFKVGKEPCGSNCFLLLEEVKRKNVDEDSTNADAPAGGKIKKNTSRVL